MNKLDKLIQKRPGKKINLNFDISIGGVTDTDLLFFTRHLALSLKAGLTLYEGLTMLHNQASGKLKKVLGKIIEVAQSGEPFYKALENYPKYFSNLYVNLVKTGEISGTLDNNLHYLSEHLKKERELKQKIKSALMYPAFIFIAVILLGFTIAIFILPKIVPLFKTLNVELPVTTKALIFVADSFATNGLVIMSLVTGGIVGFFWLIKQNFVKPFTHRLILKIPVIKGIVRNVNMQMFTHTLSTLLISAVPVDNSLKITANATENRVYRKAFNQAVLEVKKGNKLATALENYPKLFPKIASHMIAMGEKTGTLDTTLKYLSEFYQDEVDMTMKNLSTIIEPVLLIVIGSIVGTVALAILGPIYKITGNLNG